MFYGDCSKKLDHLQHTYLTRGLWKGSKGSMEVIKSKLYTINDILKGSLMAQVSLKTIYYFRGPPSIKGHSRTTDLEQYNIFQNGIAFRSNLHRN